MRFGKGGVDDAEDAEVILHELGHQIHFSASATFFATNEAGCDQRRLRRLLGSHGHRMGIRAAARSGVHRRVGLRLVHRRPRPLPAPPGYAICMYPTDLNGAVHHDGTIWSHALWNLRTAIGAAHADTAILRAQIGWTGTTHARPGEPDRCARRRARYGQGAARLCGLRGAREF